MAHKALSQAGLQHAKIGGRDQPVAGQIELIGRSTKLFLEILASLVIITGVAGAIFAWRLSQGPISLGFLTPTVQSAINAGSSTKVEIEETVLAWRQARRSLDVRAIGVAITGPDGRRVAQLPEIAVSLSARGLMRGMIAPTRLDVVGARITLTRTTDGGFGLGTGEPSEDDSTSALPLLLAELLQPPDPERSMGYLQEVSVTEAEIALFDQATGRNWRVPRADVVMTRDDAGIRAEASLVVDLAGELTRVTATALYLAGERQIDVSARTTPFEPATLAAIDPRLASLSVLRMPISGKTQFRLDPAGRLLGLEFDITGTAGTLSEPQTSPTTSPSAACVSAAMRPPASTASTSSKAWWTSAGQRSTSRRRRPTSTPARVSRLKASCGACRPTSCASCGPRASARTPGPGSPPTSPAAWSRRRVSTSA